MQVSDGGKERKGEGERECRGVETLEGEMATLE